MARAFRVVGRVDEAIEAIARVHPRHREPVDPRPPRAATPVSP